MTAASGVVHEEKHGREFTEKGGTFEMIQLWVNLPKSVKMSQPQYQGILDEQIPHSDLGAGSYARVIAGALNGVKGPARTFTPVSLFDIRLKAGSRVELSLPAGHNSALFLLRGDVTVNAAHALTGEAQIVVLGAPGEKVVLESKKDSTLLAMSGEPINEPVASYGPFVMNTQEEIMQAVADYRAGKMGRLR